MNGAARLPAGGGRPDPARLTRAIWLAALGGAAVRFALLGLPTPWYDEATTGLLGLAVLRGAFPVYFFGQPFMGALDGYLAAPLYAALGASARTLELLPVLLSVTWLGLLLRLTRETYGPRAALAASLLMLVPPDFLLVWAHEARTHYPLTLVLGVVALSLAVRAAADGPPGAPPSIGGAALAAALRAAGVARLYADHGWGHRAALADPGIRILPANATLDPYGDRGPPRAFLPELEWAPGTGVLLEPADAEGFARAARASGLTAGRRTLAGLVLFTHAPRPAPPGTPLAPAALRLRASVAPDRARLGADGDPRTRWATGRPRAAGDWIEIELAAPQPLQAVRLWTAHATDAPRGVRLEGSADGTTWRLLPAEVSTEGRLIWGGVALLRMGAHATRLDFPPVALRALRLVLTGGDRAFDWSIHELTVHAADAPRARDPAPGTPQDPRRIHTTGWRPADRSDTMSGRRGSGAGTSRDGGPRALPGLASEEALVPDQVRASHILLMYAGSMRSAATRSQAEALDQITALKTEIDGGADFAGLARTHSDCPSRAEGGDLGAFGRGQMVAAFETTAFGLAVGATSGVVETPFGYHLIRRTA